MDRSLGRGFDLMDRNGEDVMEEQKYSEKQVSLDPEELGQVTGGAAWMDDPEAIENYRKEEPVTGEGVAAEPSKKAGPVSGAGVLDRLALGMDRVKEGLTSSATRR